MLTTPVYFDRLAEIKHEHMNLMISLVWLICVISLQFLHLRYCTITAILVLITASRTLANKTEKLLHDIITQTCCGWP